MDDDMIPRFTIRDAEDAAILRRSLVFYMIHRRREYSEAASQVGADPIALSVDMQHEKERLLVMMQDITDGTMGADTPTKEK